MISEFVCFAMISEKQNISLKIINFLFFTTQKKCVYCKLRNESEFKIQVNVCLQSVKKICVLQLIRSAE